MLATGAPPSRTLDELMRFLEAQEPGLRCGVLILAEDGTHFRRGSGPGLPEVYHAARDATPITPPYFGSCEECAHVGAPAVVPDVTADRRYAERWRKLLLACGLRSVRSTPVIASEGHVLASLAMFRAEPGDPKPCDPQLLDMATHLAAIVLERELAKRKLRDSEARFRSLFEKPNVGMVLMDHRCRIRAANAAFCKAIRRSPEELVGISCTSLIHPDDLAQSERLVGELTAGTAETACFEKRWLVSDGNVIWARVNIAKTGNGGELIASVEDATARKEAEAALLNQAGLLRTITDHAAEALFMMDRSGRITFTNPAAQEMFGWAQHELLGKVLHDLLHHRRADGSVFAKQDCPLLRVLASGATLKKHEDVFYRRDGTPVLVECSNVPVQENGETVGAVLVVHDITARKQAEDALRMLNERLEERVAQEIAAREAAQARLAQAQRMEALGQLAGGIAHDFNNVLQAVSGGLSLIRRRADNAEAVRTLARMASDAASRGAAITARLLTFSRQGELRPTAVAVRPVLESLREMLAATLGAGIVVRVDAGIQLPPVLADKAQLETVLVNLAVNARDAMPAGGCLTLSARPDELAEGKPHEAGIAPGAYVRIDVTDTGVGMDAATLAHASEPFFTTKPAGQGTGLGLAMARGFAQQSGGELKISSTPGEGTTVSLWLPQVGEAVAESFDQPPARDSARPARQPVLVVDDDAMVRAALAQQIEELGYQVTTASDGLAALARLDRGETFSLLVTDFSMPGMNGLLLIDEARGRVPDLPALLLTGFADAKLGDIERLSDHRTLLLRKPIEEHVLAERLRALVRAGAPA